MTSEALGRRLEDEARCIREIPSTTYRPSPELLEEAAAYVEQLRMALVQAYPFVTCEDEQSCPVFGPCDCGADETRALIKTVLGFDPEDEHYL